MPTLQNFDEFFNTQFVIRAFLILFLVFYFFFSILLIRQVQIMTVAVRTDLNQILKFATLFNLIVAVIFLIFAIFA